MSDITKKSLVELVDLIKKKEIKSEELTQSFIKNINADQKLNAYITNCSDQAIENSKNFDNKPNLETLLPGIPIAVKDLFCTHKIKTTAGSKMLENFFPNYESTITKNLWNEGAFLLGKLNCDEYAMGSSNETSYFGNVINPIAKNTVPGGSSGGSAKCFGCKSNTSNYRNRYRWIYSSTSIIYRHSRIKTYLRTMFSMGNSCLCFIFGSGWTND